MRVITYASIYRLSYLQCFFTPSVAFHSLLSISKRTAGLKVMFKKVYDVVMCDVQSVVRCPFTRQLVMQNNISVTSVDLFIPNICLCLNCLGTEGCVFKNFTLCG